MSRLHTSFVLGYHGCEKAIGTKAVNGVVQILQSTRDFDWLGRGAYFWESDPRRAYEWAQQKAARGDYIEPFVIGAVVDLGHCLDLTVREDAELVRHAFGSFKELQEKSNLEMPDNKRAPKDPSDELVMRFLDCAVINHLHSIIKDANGIPFDSVRALLPEGAELYKGAGFKDKTHIQIAVCNPDCIKGVFHVEGPWSAAASTPSTPAKPW